MTDVSTAPSMRPNNGFSQPAFGLGTNLKSKPMKGKPKKRKVGGDVRKTLAENIRELLQERYASSANRPKDLAKDAGVTLSTVQRMMKAETGASVDNIETVAEALGFEPYMLLMPSPLLRQVRPFYKIEKHAPATVISDRPTGSISR